MPNATDIKNGLTQERLHALLSYDPATGEFRWRAMKSKKASALLGTVAGHLHAKTGYRRICIDKRLYRCNRLAWLYVTGGWPSADVDHIDGSRSNDAWGNLRAATNSQNTASQKIRATNTSGIKGVYFDARRKKWHARITVKYKMIHLGRYATAEQAADAYWKAAQTAFGQFAKAA